MSDQHHSIAKTVSAVLVTVFRSMTLGVRIALFSLYPSHNTIVN